VLEAIDRFYDPLIERGEQRVREKLPDSEMAEAA
jgi:hypothetical protein